MTTAAPESTLHSWRPYSIRNAKHECAEVEKRMRVALGRKPYPAELMDDETFAGAIVRYREIVAELQVLEVDFER